MAHTKQRSFGLNKKSSKKHIIKSALIASITGGTLVGLISYFTWADNFSEALQGAVGGAIGGLMAHIPSLRKMNKDRDIG